MPGSTSVQRFAGRDPRLPPRQPLLRDRSSFPRLPLWDICFGQSPDGWTRVQAICDFVHNRIAFDYQRARATRTAWEAFNAGGGVSAVTTRTSPSHLPVPQYSRAILYGLPWRYGDAATLRCRRFCRMVRSLSRRCVAHLRRAQQRAADRAGTPRARPGRLRRRHRHHF